MVLDEFKLKGIHSKEMMKQSLSSWDSRRERIYDHLYALNFDDEFMFLDEEYDARLWLRELFIVA